MRPQHYILHHGEPVAEPDLMRWARWFETHNDERVVARDELPGGVTVSTVFLALDHAFGYGQPVLYETMVFGGALDEEQDRYHTRDEAEAGHAAMCARVREASQ
jgi:hypothetical protein